MSRLVWDASGSRLFEIGLDRAVIYPKEETGVVWNGISRFSQFKTGGELTPYYFDGVNYMLSESSAYYAARVEALTYPDVLAIHDGTYVEEYHSRKAFDMSFRTLVGNDVTGSDLGYKIHLVYNVVATPSEVAYRSLTRDSEPILFGWDIYARPVKVRRFKPTAHVIIDSRDIEPYYMNLLEDYIYGTDETPALMPLPDQILDIFDSWIGGYGHGPFGHGPFGHT